RSGGCFRPAPETGRRSHWSATAAVVRLDRSHIAAVVAFDSDGSRGGERSRHALPALMPAFEIFLSYRRTDAAGHARALSRDLARNFPPNSIFFDRNTIESGDDFPDRLHSAVTECKALLALIGPDWLTAAEPSGARRLDDAHDFVRMEIALAIEQRKKIIPVL